MYYVVNSRGFYLAGIEDGRADWTAFRDLAMSWRSKQSAERRASKLSTFWHSCCVVKE